jgi:hypothetical protein
MGQRCCSCWSTSAHDSPVLGAVKALLKSVIDHWDTGNKQYERDGIHVVHNVVTNTAGHTRLVVVVEKICQGIDVGECGLLSLYSRRRVVEGCAPVKVSMRTRQSG